MKCKITQSFLVSKSLVTVVMQFDACKKLWFVRVTRQTSLHEPVIQLFFSSRLPKEAVRLVLKAASENKEDFDAVLHRIEGKPLLQAYKRLALSAARQVYRGRMLEFSYPDLVWFDNFAWHRCNNMVEYFFNPVVKGQDIFIEQPRASLWIQHRLSLLSSRFAAMLKDDLSSLATNGIGSSHQSFTEWVETQQLFSHARL